MRITNAITRNNVLWNLNKNEIMLDKYQTQMSTGKKIQRPSEDPIVAVRALKFRTSIREIKQYSTNSEDAKSWLGVTEQALDNTVELLQRARELCVKGATDIFTTSDRESIIAELEQIKTQFANEGNVSYAGRYIFSGYKTDTPLVFTEECTDEYEITEHFESSDITTVQKVIGDEIVDVYRLRLAYDDVTNPPTDIGGIPVSATIIDSSNPDAYNPVAGTVNFLQDTGEVIFHSDNVNGIPPAVPTTFNVTYIKNGFDRYDMVPENYFDCDNVTKGITYSAPNDEMLYQISYNQDISVNSMGNSVLTKDLMRDFDEIIDAVRSIPENNSDERTLEEMVLGEFFDGMLTKLDGHINTILQENSEIGSKVNRLDLTINRLEDDLVNFSDILSENEDVDYSEAVMNFQSQQLVYNAALMTSGKLLQNTLLNFID